MTWGKNAVSAAFSIAFAELAWRLVKTLAEYKLYSNHYPIKNKFNTVVSYGFTFTFKAKCLLAVITVAVLIQDHSLSALYEGVLEQSHLLLIWWIIRGVGLAKYMFDYTDWIRSDSGLDYATGMASNYFHGFLNLALPQNDGKGICGRIANYEDKHGVQFALNRLIILIPNSMHTKPVIKSYLMERQDRQPLEGVIRNRAGVSRPFINDVYRILIDGKPYYITVEGATPLLSYFDALHFNLTSTHEMKAMQKEIMLKFYKYLNRIVQEWPATQGQCELVFYNDYTTDGQPQDVGEVLCVHIKKRWKEIAKQKQQIDEGRSL